jgi:DNA-nicking Smr family endonuclease
MRNATLKANKSNTKPPALSLLDLNKMRAASADRAHEARLAEQAKQQLAARAQHEAKYFREALRDVTLLSPSDRVPPDQLVGANKPKAVAVQRQRDERQALVQTMSDELDLVSLMDTDANLSFGQPGIGPDVLRKLRKGHWVIQAQLDLHGLRVEEARERIVVFLQNCVKREVRCVRIVHGKGLGSVNKEPVLKGKVQRWLVQREEVLAWVQAGPNDGGSGALVVLLRPPAS